MESRAFIVMSFFILQLTSTAYCGYPVERKAIEAGLVLEDRRGGARGDGQRARLVGCDRVWGGVLVCESVCVCVCVWLCVCDGMCVMVCVW